MAKKQQIYYRWVQDREDATINGPYGSGKDAKAAAAEEVARDNSFTRLGVASVEVLIGPVYGRFRLSSEDAADEESAS